MLGIVWEQRPTRSRIPHGMRGLKFFAHWHLRIAGCRIPHGMRGLKYGGNCMLDRTIESHPAWDAWIEISDTSVDYLNNPVASRMGCVD